MVRRHETGSAELVVQTFAFLVDELGCEQPAFDDLVLPVVTYKGPICDYQISLDSGTVMTSVGRSIAGRRYTVTLPRVVFVAGLGPSNAVRVSAKSNRALRVSLDSQAEWTIDRALLGGCT